MFPANDFVTTKGTFLFDGAAAKMVMDDWAAWTGGLSQKGSSDYEHDQTRENIPGHMKLDSAAYDLDLHRGALWAVNINWTALASEMILKGEKRFTSPWWLYQKADKRICRFINFGLVSLPATIAQPEIMAAAAGGASIQVPDSFVGYIEIGTASRAKLAESDMAGVVPHKKFALDTSASWDGDAARKRMLEWAGGLGKKYAEGFTYVKGDGSKESDYLLPHSDVKDGHLVTVWGGLKAAAGRLDQADIPAKDLPGVKAHLTAHYHEFGKTAPWEKKPQRSSIVADFNNAMARMLANGEVEDDSIAAASASAETPAAGSGGAAASTSAATSSETAKMAKTDYSDKNFNPREHAYALRYMASAAMENMMSAIRMHDEVPQMSAAMGLPEHCSRMAEHVSKVCAAMTHHMQADDMGDDDMGDDGASQAAAKLPTELRSKVEQAIADCKAAKCGGLLAKAHKAALASVGASRFDKAALSSFAGMKTLTDSAKALTGEESPLTMAASIASIQRDLPLLKEQAKAAEAKAKDAEAKAKTAGESAAYDAAIVDAKKLGKVVAGADELWVRANVKGIDALKEYVKNKRPANIASTVEQGTPGAVTAAALASQTPEQRKALIESVEVPAAELAAWAQTGGGEQRLFERREAQAKKLGLIA